MVKPRKLIIHELKKESSKTGAEIFYSKKLIPINEKTNLLIQQLEDSYKSDKQVYAVFKENKEEKFPSQLQAYYDDRESEDAFIDFSTKSIKDMREQIKNVTGAKGGYYVYAEYENNKQTFIGIYLVRDTNGVIFNNNENDSIVEVESVIYMNTEKLAMACRINKAKYLFKEGKYLTFLRKNKESVSDYFMNWIAASQPESSKAYTEALYNMVNQMPLPINPETNEKYDLDEYRKKVSNLIKEKHWIVDLKELGLLFYGNEDAFINFREENQLEIDTEFKANKIGLRKFTQIDIKASGIHLKFSRGDLTDRIIEPGDGDSVIIHSAELKKKLRNEIENEGLN